MIEVWKFKGLESSLDFTARNIGEAQLILRSKHPTLNVTFQPTVSGKWATDSYKIDGRSTQWIGEWVNE